MDAQAKEGIGNPMTMAAWSVKKPGPYLRKRSALYLDKLVYTSHNQGLWML